MASTESSTYVEATTTTGAVYLKQHYAAEAQLAARKAQVLAGTLDTQYEAVMQSGAALKIPHVVNMAVTAKSDNTTVTPDYPTPTDQNITVASWYYTAMYVNSRLPVQNDYDYVTLYGGQIGYALAGQIETDCASLPAGLATKPVGTF